MATAPTAVLFSAVRLTDSPWDGLQSYLQHLCSTAAKKPDHFYCGKMVINKGIYRKTKKHTRLDFLTLTPRLGSPGSTAIDSRLTSTGA